MPSRMERYYKTDLPKQRSNMNKPLYDSIYEKGSYTNIEGIATIDKPNEIDIDQIRKLIKPEQEKKERRFNDNFRRTEHKISIEKDYDSSAYDIRDVLNKAKTERKSEDVKHRNLRNTQYDILKSLDVDANKEHNEKEELKELFNTITNNSKLNKLGDKELSLDMFDSLKSNGTNTDNSLSIKQILAEKQDYKSEENELDKSFFTSSFGFKDDDFEEMKDMNANLKKSNILMKISIFIFSVALLTGIIFAVYQFVIK